MEECSKCLAIYYAGMEKCVSGHFFGPAIRPHYLMHVVLSGKGIFRVNGSTYFLQKGEAFLIRPHEITYYKADDDDPWSYAWVAFDGYEAKSVLRQTSFRIKEVVGIPKDKEAFLKQIRQLAGLFAKKKHSEFDLLGQFYRLMAQLELEEERDQESQRQKYFQKAFDYIRHNYSYPLNISDIARHVGVDRTYLYKIFMEVEQCSPKQFLSNFRLKAAMNMLGTMEYSVTEATYSCGFKETAAFCNYFKKMIGITPSQYKKDMLENQQKKE